MVNWQGDGETLGCIAMTFDVSDKDVLNTGDILEEGMVRPKDIKVVLLDAAPIWMQGLADAMNEISGFVVSGQFSSVADLVLFSERSKPRIVMTGANRDELDPAGTIQPLREGAEVSPLVLVITTHLERPLAVRALQGGVAGYLSARIDRATLELVCRLIVMGFKVIGPEVADVLQDGPLQAIKDGVGNQRANGLSPRQQRVLELIADGKYNRQISERLEISLRIVEAHVASIAAKMGVRSRTDLLIRALRAA